MSVDALPRAGNPLPPAPPLRLPSPVRGVALWWCVLERSAEAIDRLGRSLSEQEHARAARFGTDALRHRYVAGRATLRQLLGERLGVAPEGVALRRGPRGRPELEGAGMPDFNVSNTAGVVLIAIADEPRVGVDLERQDRSVAADKLARKFLTARESAALAPLAQDERRRAFLRHWTCKEAMSKATGDGLAAPFGRIDIVIDGAVRVNAGPPPYAPGGWDLHAVDVPEGFFATLAIWRGNAGG